MARLSIEQFTAVYEAFENAGYEPQDYSGRAMYGSKCLGVVCERPVNAVLDAVASYSDEHCDDDCDTVSAFISSLGQAQTDSMGMQSIVYFPDVKWQDIPGLTVDDSDD